MSSDEKFQCRRCRFVLFERKDLSSQHDIKDACSLWYLCDDDILPWVLKFIEEGGWSKGKLYCPQCEARIGAFDFIHMIGCECGGETIPAVYCVKSKVDHMKSRLLQLENSEGDLDEEDDNEEDENKILEGDLDEEDDTHNVTSTSVHNKNQCQESNDNENFEMLDSFDIADTQSFPKELNDEMFPVTDPDSNNACDILDDAIGKNIHNEIKEKVNFASSFHHKTEICEDASIKTENNVVPVDEFELQNRNQDGSFQDSSSHGVDVNVLENSHSPLNNFKVFPVTSTVFENRCFDSDVSDAEDKMLDTTLLRSTRSTRSTKTTETMTVPEQSRHYFNSHKAVPHVLRCSCCRSWYEQFVVKPNDNRSESRIHQQNCSLSRIHQQEFGLSRHHQDCGLSRQYLDEFVNISYDASVRDGIVRNRTQCTCSRRGTIREGNDGDETFERRHLDSTYERGGIHEDLMEVQHELLNLQDMIQNEGTGLPHTRRNEGANLPHSRRNKRSIRTRRTEISVNGTNHVSEIPSRQTELQEEEISTQQGEEFEIPDNYQCPVCLDILYDPHSTACNHIFCAPCLRQLYKVSRHRPLCPLCRQRIYSVQPCLDMQDDLKRLYPDIYRQRSRVELRRPVNNQPLPSHSNVRFERDNDDGAGRIVHFLYVIRTCLIILFMLISYLLNGEQRNEHRRYARHLRLFIYFLIGLVFACCGVAVGILFTFYAYDFVKFLIGFCLFYVVITKFLVTYIAAP